MKIERFQDIEAWQLARELNRQVYRLTKKTRFAKDLNNREPLNREPNNLCSYSYC
jgi:hypothetical protein